MAKIPKIIVEHEYKGYKPIQEIFQEIIEDGEKVQQLKIIYDFVGELGSDYEAEFINGNYCKSKVSLLPAE